MSKKSNKQEFSSNPVSNMNDFDALQNNRLENTIGNYQATKKKRNEKVKKNAK